jgi:hypothetical protein
MAFKYLREILLVTKEDTDEHAYESNLSKKYIG